MVAYYIFPGIHKNQHDGVRCFDHNFGREIDSCLILDVWAIMMMIEPLVDYMVCEHMAA